MDELIEPGTQITVHLRSQKSFEGLVVEWGKSATLHSKDGAVALYIPNVMEVECIEIQLRETEEVAQQPQQPIGSFNAVAENINKGYSGSRYANPFVSPVVKVT